jgi:hypothetical protein
MSDQNEKSEMPKKSKTQSGAIHIDDNLVHIKRYKGIRGRLELYIHNQELRKWLKSVDIMFPGEEGAEAKRLTKSYLFYDIEYGLMLQAFCHYLDGAMTQIPIKEIREFLCTIEKSVVQIATNPANINPNALETDPSPWEMAYQQVTALIKKNSPH